MPSRKREVVRIRSYLRRCDLRLRLVESLTWGPWGAVAGGGVGVLLALAARIWPLLPLRWLIVISGALLLLGMTVGVLAAWLRPRSLHRRARVFDHRLGLADRLTTAVEIGTGRLRTPRAMGRAQLADTLAAITRVDVRAALPLTASRRALKVAGLLLCALVVLLWLPNPQDDLLRQRAAVQQKIEEQVAALDEMRTALAETEGLTEAEREALMQALDEAIAALEESKEHAAPEEAMAALSEVEQTLAELRDPQAAAVQKGLSEAGEALSDSSLTQDIAEALAAGDYQAAARSLAAFSGTKGRALTREEELALAEELAQAAAALAASNPALAEQMNRAAAAIQRGDAAEARAAIREAARQMKKAGEQVAGQEALESSLSQLAEGRQEIAQASGSTTASRPGQGSMAGGQMGGQGGEQAGGMAGGAAGGQGSGQQAQAGHREDAGTGAPYAEMYVPYRLDEEGVGSNIGREGGEGGMVSGEVPLPAPKEGQANVPYQEVYAEYAARAGSALEGSYIPLGMKQYVRDYFSSLEP